MCLSVLLGSLLKNHGTKVSNDFSLKLRKIVLLMLYEKVGKVNLQMTNNTKSEKLVTLIASDLQTLEYALF